MRVVILGSGVVGVTSAWYLSQAGHEVTVIDREPGSALETSAANAGQISPGYAAPWAAPGVPLQFDYGHFTVAGSALAADRLLSQIAPPHQAGALAKAPSW